MEDKPSLHLSIPNIELPKTIEDCHRVIQESHHFIRSLFEQVEKLIRENNDLKERLNNNSSNSSLPPSKDYQKKKPDRVPSKNSSGGQKGHKGHFRQLLDSQEVDFIVDCPLPTHCLCGGKINLKNDFQRHQVYELPEIKLQVTEYQLAKGCCTQCRQHPIADLPEGVTWGITGPRLTGLMSHLVSNYQLSRREVKAFLKEQFHFNLSLGTVFNKQKMVNAALETPTAELLTIVKESPCVNVDETGHQRDGKKQWMWCVVSSTIAYFSIAKNRGKKVLKSLMGDYPGIVISDRYAVYNYFESSHRQICWAHLKRDFRRISEKENKLCARIGKHLLLCEAELFEIWHAFKQSQITRDELLRQSEPIRRRLGELLEQGSYTDPSLKIARFCKNLLKHFNALWVFLSTEHVEPTNNHAERCLRPAVTWRKKYFGTRSDDGSEFVARSISVKMTCQLQGKNAFEFLCQTLQCFFEKKLAPPL